MLENRHLVALEAVPHTAELDAPAAVATDGVEVTVHVRLRHCIGSGLWALGVARECILIYEGTATDAMPTTARWVGAGHAHIPVEHGPYSYIYRSCRM